MSGVYSFFYFDLYFIQVHVSTGFCCAFQNIYVIWDSIAVGRTGSSSDHVDQQVLVLPSYESKKIWLVSFSTLLDY